MQGVCGFENPQAMKNGSSFCAACFMNSMALSAFAVSLAYSVSDAPHLSECEPCPTLYSSEGSISRLPFFFMRFFPPPLLSTQRRCSSSETYEGWKSPTPLFLRLSQPPKSQASESSIPEWKILPET